MSKNQWLAAVVVVVMAVIGLVVVAEIDTRQRVGRTEALIDPCAGALTQTLSDSCRARTCVRLRSVSPNNKHLFEYYPACRPLLERVDDGSLPAAPVAIIHTDTTESD